jgi:hypothetical protein
MHRLRQSCAIALLAAVSTLAVPTEAANIAWIGGNGTWSEGAANNANWNPADEPDSNDAAIFNTANAVSMESNNTVNGLTLSNGFDLHTNSFDLTVDGLVQVSNASTNLVIGGADTFLNADSMTINADARIQIDGGTLQIDEESGNGLLDINADGLLFGHGTVNLIDALAATTTLVVNDGTITAQRSPLIIFGAPQVGTLTFNATDADARIDLDGAAENGEVSVGRNQTLDINIRLFDIFNGSLSMAQSSTLDMSNDWILGAFATIDVDNGAAGGIPAVPAGIATIAGSTFSQNSGTITVLDNDGTLQFDAPFTMNGGALANNGLVVFNSSTTIAAAANFTMPTTASSLTVAANRTVNINQNNFNLDGANSATNVITVTTDATLNINTTDYDPDSATNAFDGTVNLTSATINVNVSDAEFVMDGVLNSSASGSDQSLWTGDALDIGNDAGVLDADVNITGTQPTQFGAQVDFNSDADMDVADGAAAHFLAVVNFNSVNGGNNAQFTGAGEMIFSAGVNFSETTTLNMVGGTVDLDGADSIGDTINIDAPLTINAELMRSFGKNNGGGGTNLLDVNNSISSGSLTVNLDNSEDEWTLNAQGVMNLINDNTEATLLAGNDLNVNGTVNVTGDVRTTARLDIGATAVINVNTAAQPLRLAAGNETTDVNTIAGGTVNGVGVLGADTGKALHGFGTINTQIDFDGTSDLMADNGTLNVDGTKILDVETLGTADVDGVLNVANAWNNNVTAGVQLRGGTLNGGTMTNDTTSGISGHGLVTARVINNTQLFASFDNTLIFETALNDNDWDGATGDGEIEAISGNIELRDVGAAFGFAGTVSATNGYRAFTNGFALNFNPGSTLILATGGKLEATASTDLGGAVTVGAGGATIEVENNNFLTFEATSATTLGSNLTLLNNNIIIEDNATFSGAGALVFPDGSNLVAENGADIGVLLDMQGGFRPGNSEGIARVDLFDFQLAGTSELFVELTGTSLNAFDRLVASGDAIVDGYLNVDIDGGFVPALGQTFNIITANSVTGEFDFADVSGMPPGLAFHIEYLSNAVQLQVVNEPFFSADFDDDGDVDPTDLAIWRGAFDLNQLGDADGDNDSDGNDFLAWQQQLGSAPVVAAATPVPEPSGGVLTFCSLLGLWLNCRAVGRSSAINHAADRRWCA